MFALKNGIHESIHLQIEISDCLMCWQERIHIVMISSLFILARRIDINIIFK